MSPWYRADLCLSPQTWLYLIVDHIPCSRREVSTDHSRFQFNVNLDWGEEREACQMIMRIIKSLRCDRQSNLTNWWMAHDYWFGLSLSLSLWPGLNVLVSIKLFWPQPRAVIFLSLSPHNTNYLSSSANLFILPARSSLQTVQRKYISQLNHLSRPLHPGQSVYLLLAMLILDRLRLMVRFLYFKTAAANNSTLFTTIL